MIRLHICSPVHMTCLTPPTYTPVSISLLLCLCWVPLPLPVSCCSKHDLTSCDGLLFSDWLFCEQLLMPHVRTSPQINFGARVSLLAPDGVFDKVQTKLCSYCVFSCSRCFVDNRFIGLVLFLQAVGCGLEALPILLSRSSKRMSYRSLCVPDDLSDRGVDKLPQSYYAEDALRVWNALHR